MESQFFVDWLTWTVLGVVLGTGIIHLAIAVLHTGWIDVIYSAFALLCSAALIRLGTGWDAPADYLSGILLVLSLISLAVLYAVFFADTPRQETRPASAQNQRDDQGRPGLLLPGLVLTPSACVVVFMRDELTFAQSTAVALWPFAIWTLINNLRNKRLTAKEKADSVKVVLLLFVGVALGLLDLWNWITVGVALVIAERVTRALRQSRSKPRWICGAGAVTFAVSIGTTALSFEGYLQLHNAFLPGIAALALSMSLFLAFRYAETSMEADRKTQELEHARRLQLSLLPTAFPTHPAFDFSWQMRTASEVGGDYYDFSIAPNGALTLCVGDATGHGMDSGLVVTGTKSLFQTFADASSITDSLQVMSRSLRGMNLPRMGMAMTLLRLEKNGCTVSSAGMPPVMIYRVATRNVEEIEVSGYPLGVSDFPQYQEERFEVAVDDVILMMSDGLPERLNSVEEYLTTNVPRRCSRTSQAEHRPKSVMPC